MKIEIEVHVHVHESDSDTQHIEAKVNHAIVLMQKVLEAVVNDPAKLAEITKQIKDHTESLKSAVTAASSPT